MGFLRGNDIYVAPANPVGSNTRTSAELAAEQDRVRAKVARMEAEHASAVAAAKATTAPAAGGFDCAAFVRAAKELTASGGCSPHVTEVLRRMGSSVRPGQLPIRELARFGCRITPGNTVKLA